MEEKKKSIYEDAKKEGIEIDFFHLEDWEGGKIVLDGRYTLKELEFIVKWVKENA